jgi:hypothetical protein
MLRSCKETNWTVNENPDSFHTPSAMSRNDRRANKPHPQTRKSAVSERSYKPFSARSAPPQTPKFALSDPPPRPQIAPLQPPPVRYLCATLIQFAVSILSNKAFVSIDLQTVLRADVPTVLIKIEFVAVARSSGAIGINGSAGLRGDRSERRDGLAANPPSHQPRRV